MRHRLTFLTSAVLLKLLVMTTAVHPANPWTNTFYFENDLFNGTDSNSTNGVKYSIISPDLAPQRQDQGRLPKKALDQVATLPFVKNSGHQTSHRVEFSLGQNMYTPADISLSFSENLRTKEFNGQPKAHGYGSMDLSFSFLC